MTSDDIAVAEMIAKVSMVGLGTAPELWAAVCRDFGTPTVDLAASAADALCPVYVTKEQNSLGSHTSWTKLIGEGTGWLNPPPGDITPWAAKCAAAGVWGTKVLLLAQGCIDAPWFWDYVWQHADIYVLQPRMNYEGFPYPLLLCHYGTTADVGGPKIFSWWKWARDIVDSDAGGGV